MTDSQSPAPELLPGATRSRWDAARARRRNDNLAADPEHLCHALGCRVRTAPKLLMCRHHWGMVPKTLQTRVWATYVPGQEITKIPSAEYLDAAMAAINAVAELERRKKPEVAVTRAAVLTTAVYPGLFGSGAVVTMKTSEDKIRTPSSFDALTRQEFRAELRRLLVELCGDEGALAAALAVWWRRARSTSNGGEGAVDAG